MAELKQMAFNMNDDVKEALVAGYGDLDSYFEDNKGKTAEANIFENIKGIQDVNLRMSKLSDFRLLLSMQDSISSNYSDGNSSINLMYNNDSLLLKIKDLGYSKLNLAIQNGRTIVFDNPPQNAQEAKAKLEELYSVFSSLGLSARDFNFPDGCEDYKDVFEAQEQEDNILREQEAKEVMDAQASGVDKDAGKKEYSIKDMDEKAKFRIGLMGAKLGKNVRRKYTSGGWLQFDFYKSENDMQNDGKWDDKAGEFKHTATAKLGMKLDKKTGCASFRLYTPFGSKPEECGDQIKIIMQSLKAVGNTHISIPSTSGKMLKELWVACGENLVVPDASGKHFPSEDDMDLILDTVEKKNQNQDKKKINEWRKNMIQEIFIKKGIPDADMHNLSLSDKEKLGSYIKNIEKMRDAISPVENASRLKSSEFAGVLSAMESNIENFRNASGEKYDTFDALAYGRAYANILDNYKAPDGENSVAATLYNVFEGDADKIESCKNRLFGICPDLKANPDILNEPMHKNVLNTQMFLGLMTSIAKENIENGENKEFFKGYLNFAASINEATNRATDAVKKTMKRSLVEYGKYVGEKNDVPELRGLETNWENRGVNTSKKKFFEDVVPENTNNQQNGGQQRNNQQRNGQQRGGQQNNGQQRNNFNQINRGRER